MRLRGYLVVRFWIAFYLLPAVLTVAVAFRVAVTAVHRAATCRSAHTALLRYAFAHVVIHWLRLVRTLRTAHWLRYHSPVTGWFNFGCVRARTLRSFAYIHARLLHMPLDCLPTSPHLALHCPFTFCAVTCVLVYRAARLPTTRTRLLPLYRTLDAVIRCTLVHCYLWFTLVLTLRLPHTHLRFTHAVRLVLRFAHLVHARFHAVWFCTLHARSLHTAFTRCYVATVVRRSPVRGSRGLPALRCVARFARFCTFFCTGCVRGCGLHTFARLHGYGCARFALLVSYSDVVRCSYSDDTCSDLFF